jgi:sulfhydrogenase subunit beta (sulfur reductase)
VLKTSEFGAPWLGSLGLGQDSRTQLEVITVAEEQHRILRAEELTKLIELLSCKGYRTIGPFVRDGAIVYERIESSAQLPAGWTDEQERGFYRLKRREDQAWFGYAVGPHSWKRYLLPAEVRLWSAERRGRTFRILNNEMRPKQPYALLGVRACDLAAIKVQDRVLIGDKYRDAIYAVATCFCASLGTGPRAQSGFDLALTELEGPAGHRFVVQTGSERGAEVLAGLQTVPAAGADSHDAEAAVDRAASEQVRSIDTAGIKELLYQNFDHPRWDNVAARCLTCANCTMVCPTCFCTSVEDVTYVTSHQAERWRRWDSCFTLSFSYIHGGNIRTSGKARYRQWMTHKLASWIDQFGTWGCVGCGRCIAWCPVGIDITEEVRALREGGNHGDP